MKRWLLALALVMRGTALDAQAPIDSTTTFRSGVDIVALHVVVTDAQHKLVMGLTANDFAVFEDGVRQDVSFFGSAHVPLDLAILLDTSSSMMDRIRMVQDAAVGFASALRPGDRVSVVDIKGSVRILHPLNGDIAAAYDAIRRTVAGGNTALYNGLYLALKDMMNARRQNGEVRRQAIVVLSDGDDTASLVSVDDIMETTKQAGVAVYTITLRPAYGLPPAGGGYGHFSQSEYVMKALAQETGALAFLSTDIAELAGVYSLITQELASQYVLGYTSKNPARDGSFRRVSVRVPGMRARTRSGYLAPRLDRPAFR
ncbi:MAG: VWA domain-containing protein [Acidobacteria bacterium]|nr:VWA domain-containing protein [Acidobacteriota bacterium]